MKAKKFNELTENIPKCYATNCKNKAVYKAGKMLGKPFGYCEKHSWVLKHNLKYVQGLKLQ